MNFQHFIYALLNILNEMSPYILLGFLIAGVLHVFVRPEVMSRHLSGKGWKPVLKAALFGIPLPLCSCGVLPTAVSLRRQGASKGASTSFLIATPQTGVDSIAATYALLGLPFAILRPVAALAGAFAGGLAVDRSEQHESKKTAIGRPDAPDGCTDGCCMKPDITSAGLWQKLIESVRYGMVDMVASVGKWLVIGLIIAAIITVAVPDSLFLSLSAYPLAGMLVMVAVAVPMYICATGSIPIALSLMIKGLTPGVAFVLLMAGPAANFASVMVLRKSLGNRATALYVGSVTATAIAFGLIIDYLLPREWFLTGGSVLATPSCHVEFSWFSSLCSALLAGLLLYAFARSRKATREFHNHITSGKKVLSDNTTNTNITNMQTIHIVKGMSCNHCKASVEKALSSLPGVTAVAVDLPSGKVAVEGSASSHDIAEAIANAGFEYAGEA